MCLTQTQVINFKENWSQVQIRDHINLANIFTCSLFLCRTAIIAVKQPMERIFPIIYNSKSAVVMSIGGQVSEGHRVWTWAEILLLTKLLLKS